MADRWQWTLIIALLAIGLIGKTILYGISLLDAVLALAGIAALFGLIGLVGYLLEPRHRD